VRDTAHVASTGIGFSWYFWPGWSGHGNRLSSLFNRRRSFGFHRQLFRFFWKRKSKVHSNQPRISLETITLIKEMATNNRLWGAQRIRGELLKLDIPVCKRTIQKYMRQARVPRPGGQNWSTFLRNHAKEVWACDFLQVTDLFFRPLFAFFVVELKSRKVIHVGVTRSPSDAWTAQQLREATPYGQTPRYLLRDNDGKFGPCFAQVASRKWHQDPQNTLSRSTGQRNLRTFFGKYSAGVFRPTADPP
jgi:hypothetical protein